MNARAAEWRGAALQVRRWMLIALAAVAGLVVIVAVTALLVERQLRAAPDDWATTVRIGPLERRWQVAAVARLATKPGVARLLDGRSRATPWGTWTLRRDADGRLVAVCEPCVIRSRALGDAPLRLDRLALELAAARGDDYAGRLHIGRDARVPAVDWRLRLDARGMVLDAGASSLPIAALLASVEPRLPELSKARVEGTIGFSLRYGGDPLASVEDETRARWMFEPRIEGFRVTGLGTEALANAAPPARCGAGAPIAGWLPIAVLAAEDQSFSSHAGYDVDALRNALARNATRDATARFVGGSTLTQQLAKLVYTGDARDPTRKLRELLYAVEMEETLGKARILQLYLAIAPWGPGICGAERAADRYLGKPASRLDPLEAAWLAGLLRNPSMALRDVIERCAIDAPRTAWVLDQMRPMALWRRNHWLARVSLLRPLPATRNTRCLADVAQPVAVRRN